MEWKLSTSLSNNPANPQARSTAWPAPRDPAPGFSTLPAEESIDALVQGYWRALGVTDLGHREALTRMVRARLARRIPDIASEDLPERALREIHEIIDEWLAAALAQVDCPHLLATARTVLLSGALADWPAALLNPDAPSRKLVRQLCNSLPEPTPPPAPLPMPAQPIELRRSLWAFLFCRVPFRLGRIIFIQLRTLFGNRP